MSTLPPECEQLLISGYVLGNLSPAEALLFEEMLRENPDLIGQITAMQQALDLTYIAPEISPPNTLRDRVLAAANAQKVNVKTAKPSVNQAEITHSLQPKLLGKVLAAIALATIAILGIANYRLWRTIQTLHTDVDSAIVQKTYLLEGEDLPKTTTAKLIVNPNQLKATLIANNLPVLPPEKVYALWTVVGKDVPYTTDDKGAILTAVFQVNKSGNFKREIAIPQPHLEPRTISKMAITVEDKSAPQAHTGSIFIATRDKS
ncbi:MAG: anti-sigma factor domain-containing protein [Pleurocapsa sp.]